MWRRACGVRIAAAALRQLRGGRRQRRAAFACPAGAPLRDRIPGGLGQRLWSSSTSSWRGPGCAGSSERSVGALRRPDPAGLVAARFGRSPHRPWAGDRDRPRTGASDRLIGLIMSPRRGRGSPDADHRCPVRLRVAISCRATSHRSPPLSLQTSSLLDAGPQSKPGGRHSGATVPSATSTAGLPAAHADPARGLPADRRTRAAVRMATPLGT